MAGPIPFRALVFSVTAAAFGSTFASAPAAAAASGPFLSHQALYELSLIKSRGSNAISGARGRILYNFSGSACEGYALNFPVIGDADLLLLAVSDRALHEVEVPATNAIVFHCSGVHPSIRGGFSLHPLKALPPVGGVAERVGDHITVKLKQPVSKTFNLDGNVVFPTEQIQHIIAAARQGKSVLELTVYDGSDNGEKVYNTLSVIGQPISGTKTIATPDPSTANDQMKSAMRWPVTVSYYDRDAKRTEGEQTPVYAMSFELYENGVSRSLVLDYNDFVIAGALGKFDVKDAKPCK